MCVCETWINRVNYEQTHTDICISMRTLVGNRCRSQEYQQKHRHTDAHINEETYAG